MAIILQHPQDTTVTEGNNAQFYCEADSEAPLSQTVYYQWQSYVAGQWEDIELNKNETAASSTLVITGTTLEQDGDRYRCTVWDDEIISRKYSNIANLYVNESSIPPLSIISQPGSLIVEEDNDAMFIISVTGGETPYTYQWYEITPDITGDSVTITSSPSNKSVIEGNAVSFVVSATGTQPISYEWQEWDYNSDGYFIVTTSNASGINERTLTINPTTISGDDGRRFRCKVDNEFGPPDYSSPATLTVEEQSPADIPVLDANQPSDLTANHGGSAQFIVTVIGGSAPFTYQWQEEIDVDWINLESTSYYTGEQSDRLLFNLSVDYNRDNGRKFRCVVSNSSGTVNSNYATLTVNEPPPTYPTIIPPNDVILEALSSVEVKIKWRSPDVQETHYIVYRSDRGDLGQFSKETLNTEGDYYVYIDTFNLEASTTYNYRLACYRSMDNKRSDYSDNYFITTLSTPPAGIFPPIDFLAEYISSPGIRLTWNEPNTSETHYEIQKKKSIESNWIQFVVIPIGTSLYWDYNIEELTTYNYRIRSVNYETQIESEWTLTDVTTGEFVKDVITHFTKTVNGTLQIKADPYDNDPTGQIQPRWETVPYSVDYNSNSNVSIQFPRMVGIEEFVEITDNNGRAWFTNDPDVSYNSSTDNYTISITIPTQTEYSIDFRYREIKDAYDLILKSVDPNSGVKFQLSDDGGESFTIYFSDFDNPPNVSYDEFTVVLVKVPAKITGNTEFAHFLRNGEIIEIPGTEPTIELNMVQDFELFAVYREVVSLAAPSITVTDGYERIYIDILQPTGGQVPTSFKVYKKLFGPISPDPKFLGPPIKVDEEPQPIKMYDDLTIPPLEYTLSILNEYGYFFFEEIENTGGIIRFIDENVPLDYTRCYVVSSNLDETEVFAAKKCGESNITGLGIRWTTQPESQTVDLGTDVTFTAIASGVEAIKYQWYVNGNEITGGTGSILTLLNVTSELDNNTYYCIATDIASGEKIKTIEAILRIRIIEAPTNLSGTVNLNNVLLSWRDNSSNEDGFIIYHSFDGTSFDVLETLGSNSIDFTDSNITYGTRKWYRISAYINTEESEFTNIISVLVEDPTSVAPYGLTATGNLSVINLNWIDDSSTENGFKIWYSENDIDYILLSTVGANVTTYNHTGLLPELTYFYRVTSYNNYGESAYSNTASATTLSLPEPELPPVDNYVRKPIGLNAVIVDGGIVLSWIDDSTNEKGFNIYRSTNGQDFEFLITVDVNIVSYFDQEDRGGITYWYKVQAYNDFNESQFSNIVSATTKNIISIADELTAPYGLNGTSFVNKNILYWNSNNKLVDGYNIYADTNNDKLFEIVSSVQGNILQYTHDNLESNITVSYRVTAFIGNKESDPSNIVILTTKEIRDEPRIGIPSGINVISDVKTLKIIWMDTSYGEKGFEIWVSDNGSDFKLLTGIPADVTEYIHQIGVSGITKYYKIRAYTEDVYSNFSEIVSGTTREPESIPKSPTNLITFSGKRSINLYWQINGKNETGFNIYRSIGGKDEFLKIAEIYSLGINNIDKYTDYNLTIGDKWCYKVSAFNSLGESDYTNISCTTVSHTTQKPDGSDIDIEDIIDEFEGGFNVVNLAERFNSDWGQFTQNLSQYFDSKKAKDENDAAKYISKLYDDTIKQGSEQYGNMILSSNPQILENFISLALNEIKAGAPNQSITQKLSQGVISYWSTIVLQANIPPPGSTMALYNTIISPGVPGTLPIFNTTNSSDLANSLSTFFSVHSKTVAGILTSLVSTPSGPIPTPFGWSSFG